MEDTPLVSVLMTAYNREKYIGEAIQSVLDSTYANFELIIVDDRSKDTTVEIARCYAAKDSRIRIYINEKNLGDYPNRNQAASYAKGEFIMYVDSDDKILKNGFERCVSAMCKFDGADFGMFTFQQEKEPFQLESNAALRLHLLQKPFLMIGPGGTILRRTFFERIKGYPVKYGPANDQYFNLKACSQTSSVIMLPFEFLFYRYHDGQEQNNYFSYLHNNFSSCKASLDDFKLPITKKELKWLHKKNKRRFIVNILKYFFKTGNFQKTREALEKTNFSFKDALTGVFH